LCFFFFPRRENDNNYYLLIKFFETLEDDVGLDSSGASGSAAEEVWPNSNGGANHYDVASAWMDNDAANEELHRYSQHFLIGFPQCLMLLDAEKSGEIGKRVLLWAGFWILYNQGRNLLKLLAIV
jgi:hypothetical protein